MPTLEQLVANVRHRLAGAGAYTEQSYELLEDITEGDLSFQVDPASDVPSPGIYEIGLERIRVKAVDRASNRLQAFRFGRGYAGTVASVHNQGAEVVKDPVAPAGTVAQEINGVLMELYPSLYGVKHMDVEYVQPGFRVPDEAVGIVAVFLADTADGGYRRVDRWRWEPDVNNGLVIHGACTGTPVRVTYAVEPGTFPLDVLDVESADFGETTGLPDRLADLLTLGVAYRLAPMADMSKLTATGVDVRSDDTKRPEAGVRLQQAFYRQFQARIQQEQLALHQQHPIRVHGQRGL